MQEIARKQLLTLFYQDYRYDRQILDHYIFAAIESLQDNLTDTQVVTNKDKVNKQQDLSSLMFMIMEEDIQKILNSDHCKFGHWN